MRSGGVMMRAAIRSSKTPLVLTAAAAMITATFAAQQSGLWTVSGQNTSNTRFQSEETKIGAANAAQLQVKWSVPTDGDVSATPAVDGQTVYFPDWAGFIYAVDRKTGALEWKVNVQDVTGVPQSDGFGNPGGVARVTPAIAGNALIFGDQGGRAGQGAKVFALDRRTGATLWVTQVQGNGADPADATFGAQFAIVTQSAIVDDKDPSVAYVGTASWEEAMAAFIPGYVCCTFRGTVVAISTKTGQILWRTYMAPATPGYSGNAVWGSTASIDAARKTLYVTTGNNYSVPAAAAACVQAAATPEAKAACLAADNYFDAIVALDTTSGAVKWATKALPYDAWNVNCIPGFGLNPCPEPAGPDYDFGQGPLLFSAKAGNKSRSLVGAGQKSGMFWALDRDTGAVVWSTQVGPGGTMGGLQWGSATDGTRIYAAVNNSLGIPWTPHGSAAPITGGAWSAIDPATGAIVWQTAIPASIPGLGAAVGAMTVANGVVYGCTFTGTWAAMNAQTGAVLWSRPSPNGEACAAGASVSRGTVYWGTGYNQIMFLPVQPSALYAFSVPGANDD